MKKLLIILVLLGLIVAGGLGGVSWWLLQRLGPEECVYQLERNTNCRAQVEDAQILLFTQPAQLVFKGVQIAPKDQEVEKPLAERMPLAAGSAAIVIPEIVLEVKLEDLLKRRLFVEQLRLVAPVVQESQDENGRSTLEALFKKPKRGPKTADIEASVPRALPVSQDQTLLASPAPTVSKDVQTKSPEQGFAFTVNNASIEDGTLTIQNAAGTVRVENLQFSLTGIDIDPADLANHNRMEASLKSDITVTGMARIGGVKKPAELARLKLEGSGTTTPIDPATGEWQPYTLLKMTLAKGSTLAGHLTMGDAAGKEMKKLMEYGIDLSPVVIGGQLQEPAVVQGAYRANIFSLLGDTHFAFPDYEVVVQRKSHINTARNLHEAELRLSCGQALQQRLMAGVSQAKLGDSITQGIVKALADERGRLTFDIESEGSLSDPEVKPKLDRLLKNLLRGEGLGDLLQGLLKKL